MNKNIYTPYSSLNEREALAAFPRLSELNKLILSRIQQQEQVSVLGLLNISTDENSEIIETVNLVTKSPHYKRDRVLLEELPYAAVIAYAMSIIVSSNESGKEHWKAINRELGLASKTSWNEKFKTCLIKIRDQYPEKLIVDKLGHQASYVNFQAGIRKSWTDSLKSRLKKQKYLGVSLPHIHNHLEVREYASSLAGHDKLPVDLTKALESGLGVLIVELLCRYKDGDTDIIAPHLNEVFKEVYAPRAKRKNSIKQPFVRYKEGELEVVLPPIRLEAISESSKWLVEGNIYRVNHEKAIACCDLPHFVRVVLCNDEGRDTGEWEFKTRPDENEPIFIFDAKTGKKQSISLSSDTVELNSGEYTLCIYEEVQVNEPYLDCFSLARGCSSYLRWNDDSLYVDEQEEVLELSFKGRKFLIVETIANCFSFELNGNNSLTIEGDYPLLYGVLDIALKNYNDIVSIGIMDLWRSKSETTAVNSSLDLSTAILQFIENLPTGVSFIQLETNTKIKQRFYYWKELKAYDNGFFEFDDIDYIKSCKLYGYEFFAERLREINDWVDIERKIFLPNGLVLKSPTQGVICLLKESGEDEGVAIKQDSVISLRDDENRIIEFRSGGFDHWEIKDDSGDLLQLSPRRRTKSRSLSRLAMRGAALNEIKCVNHRDAKSLFTKSLFNVQKPFSAKIERVQHRNRELKLCLLEEDDFHAVGVTYHTSSTDELGSPEIIFGNEKDWRKVEDFVVGQAFDLDAVRIRKTGLEIRVACDFNLLEYGGHWLRFHVLDEEGVWHPLQDIQPMNVSDLALVYWGGNLTDVNNYQLATKSFEFYKWYLTSSVGEIVRDNCQHFYDQLSDIKFRVRTSPKFDKEWWRLAVEELGVACVKNNVRQSPYFLVGEFPDVIANIECDTSPSNLISATMNLSGNDQGSYILRSTSEYVSEAQFLLKDLLLEFNEKREEYIERDRMYSSVDEILSDKHFHFAMTKLEERTSDHREKTYRGEGNGRREEIAMYAFERIWANESVLKNKEKKFFNERLSKAGLQNFDDIYGKMWFAHREDKKDEFTKHISYIYFRVALVGRLLAHKKISKYEFDDEFHKIFREKRHFSDLLAFGPELFSFYVRLFDEALKHTK